MNTLLTERPAAPRGRQIARLALSEIAVFLCAFAVTTAPLGPAGAPFGIAFLCAGGEYSLFAALGTVFSSLLFAQDKLFSASLFLAIFLLRVAAGALESVFAGGQAELFRERLPLRLTVAAFGVLVSEGVRVITAGTLFYDLFPILFALVSTLALTASLYGLSVGTPGERHFTVGVFALLLALTAALSGIGLSFFNVGASFALLAVSYVAHRYGIGGGASLGILLGIPFGAVGVAVTGVFGLAVGALSSFSTLFALAVGWASSFAMASAGGGTSALSLWAAPLIFAVALSYPLSRLRAFPPRPTAEPVRQLPPPDGRLCVRVEKMARAFGNLAASFADLAERRPIPSPEETERICAEACGAYCEDCRKRTSCWGSRADQTRAELHAMAEGVSRYGMLSRLSVPDSFLAECPHAGELIDDVNRRFAVGIGMPDADVYASLCASVSEALDGLAKEERESYEEDVRAKIRLEHAFRRAGIPIAKVRVSKDLRLVSFSCADENTVSDFGAAIVRAVSETLGLPFSFPSERADGGAFFAEMRAVKRFRCVVASETDKLPGSDANGDAVQSFEGDGCFYTMISDGMGSGSAAARASGAAVSFLREMLAGGIGKPGAIRMLNRYLRACGEECSATVDLAGIDLETGIVRFVKSGAAPSFVRRGENVFRLESRTAPVGIMRLPDAEEITFNLKEGDDLVMISDGVAQSFEESGWLVELLSHTSAADPSLCKTILSAARARSPRADDMTVAVVHVEEDEKGALFGRSSAIV